jgi:hypothetical protein
MKDLSNAVIGPLLGTDGKPNATTRSAIPKE